MPTEERKPAWCAACLAYREKRRAGASDQEAHEAAVAAVQDVWPLPWKEATRWHSRSVPATDSCTAAKPSLGATPSSTRAREEQAWLPVRCWSSSILRPDFTQAQGFFLQVRSNGLAGYPRQSKIKMLQYLV